MGASLILAWDLELVHPAVNRSHLASVGGEVVVEETGHAVRSRDVGHEHDRLAQEGQVVPDLLGQEREDPRVRHDLAVELERVFLDDGLLCMGSWGP